MYNYSLGSINMGKNVSLNEVAINLSELTGFDFDFIVREIRHMKKESELILWGEGDSIANVSFA